MPDKNGKLDDVVLGFDTLDGYLAGHPCFGAIVGRYANPIAKGKCTLDGAEYQLATNNGPNHLRGGLKGFDRVLWQARSFENEHSVALAFTYTRRDSEEGYPGNRSVKVTYTLTNSFSIITPPPTRRRLST